MYQFRNTIIQSKILWKHDISDGQSSRINKTLCQNDSWLKEKRDSCLKKLLFMNGYFDGVEDKFYDKETYRFNPDILFMNRISHDFKNFDDDVYE